MIWSDEIEDVFGHFAHKQTFTKPAAKQKDEIIQVLNGANYRMGQLGKALESKSELMIKCDSYYAIDAKYDDLLVTLLESR